MPSERHTYDLTGIVQGVGFRPTLYRLATAAGLRGSVQNRTGTVRLILEGCPDSIQLFMEGLKERLPVQASLDKIQLVSCETIHGDVSEKFEILESQMDSMSRVSIPVDLGICPVCRQEIMNPSDRHFRYPFTSCTNCGPRYTVIEDMPYDRIRTTLEPFPLCPDCLSEYSDPLNRRFHAESTCCPVCGPKLDYRDQLGLPIVGDPLRLVRRDLHAGKIVAIRGLGGFLLAVNALNGSALKRLRSLKRRPHKPFAVMARNLQVAERFARIPDEAQAMLCSAKRPILVCEITDTAKAELPMDQITPDAATLGVMLPVAPLFELLMSDPADPEIPAFSMLVMTSGNRRGEPICISNEEALDRMSGIADRFLLHNREINLRNDDSLCALQQDKIQVWRRARGFSPEAIPLSHAMERNVLAMGAHLKNTIVFGYNDEIVLSPHVGDLDTPEALDGLNEIVESLPHFLGRKPELVAVDLHPDYHSSRLGQIIAEKHALPIIEVQHHHAHALSVMCEHALQEALVLVFDGTGLGLDGDIWGAELFHIDPDHITHPASFLAAPLPGGDVAVLRPVRQLLSRWVQTETSPSDQWLRHLGVDPSLYSILRQQIQQRLNSSYTTAAGRVFDAFSTWLGLSPPQISYDGQAAIRLEACARRSPETTLVNLPGFSTCRIDDRLLVDWRSFFAGLSMLPVPDDTKIPELALAFHKRIAEAAHTMVLHGAEKVSTRIVCLSGGVFMNKILCDMLVPILEQDGFHVFQHRKVPPNDGGISLGQAIFSDRKSSRNILAKQGNLTTIQSNKKDESIRSQPLCALESQ